MEIIELKAEPRQATGRGVKQLRRQGFVPAVIYGKDLETELLQVEAKSLKNVLSVAGTHQLISLKVADQKPRMTLARDIQRDIIKHNCLHVDFYAVKMDEKVHAQVPLLIEGVAPAVRDQGGILIHGLDYVEIECLPSDLISAIKVDVSSLVGLHDAISVADLEVPDSFTIFSDPESMIVKIEPPRKVEEEEVEEEEEEVPVSAEPEVLTASKKEEEE